MVLTSRLRITILVAFVALSACTDAPAVEPTPTLTLSPSTSSAPASSESADPQAGGTSATPSATAGPVSEQPSAAGPDPGTDEGPSEPGEDRQRLVGDLDGTRPPSGDLAATGRFQGVLTPLEATVELCYDLFVSDLSSAPTGAELRHVPDDESRTIVELAPPDDGHVEECVLIEGGEAVGLYQTPEQYEVWVFTEDHPAGAVAGALREG